MIRNKGEIIDDIHYHDQDGRHRTITYVYYQGRKLWELIIGFIFTKDNYSVQTKDNYIIKAKDQ